MPPKAYRAHPAGLQRPSGQGRRSRRLRTTVPFQKLGQLQQLDADFPTGKPFGHGLSYTTFAISNVRLSAEAIPADGSVTVTADVQNTGQRSGDEVVQLYIRDRVASVTRPVRELRGFERLTLEPGEFDVWVGDSSAVADNPPDPNDPQHATFRVTG